MRKPQQTARPLQQPAFLQPAGFNPKRLARRLASKRLIARSRVRRVPREPLMPKTIVPVREVGKLLEQLSAKGFDSKALTDYLTSQKVLEPLKHRSWINPEKFVDFAVKEFFPLLHDTQATAEVRQLLHSLAGFINRHLYAKSFQWPFKQSPGVRADVAMLDKEFKRRIGED